MADTFPNGYANRLVTFAELQERHAPKMHPEYARRIFACIAAADGLVGIGNGWRSHETQAANHAKAPNTFAPPGSSFHEEQAWASGIGAYAAVDVVGRHARHDQAWNWMRDNAGRFGLCTFWDVNGEPWHVQFADLPKGAKAWKAAGSPDPIAHLVPVSPSAAKPTTSVSAPSLVAFADFPANPGKPAIGSGCHGDVVRYLQQVIADKAGGQIAVDGEFGPQTEGRVKDVQFVATLPTTGIADWHGTWQFVDFLAGYEAPASAPPGVAVTVVDTGHYWVQRGDSPWRVAELAYGDGGRHPEFEPTDPPAPGFATADHSIRLPHVRGRTTTVAPGEGPSTVVRRLFPESAGAPLLDRFLALNGGAHRALRPGDLVFLDEPA